MTHGLGPGKRGPRAAKPITPPYVENNYRIEVKITFMLIAYLVLLCEFFWEFSIFQFFRPLVDIYWHPLIICAMEIQKIHVVVHIFSGFALFTESECIAELNPSASCWPLTRCILIYQQTGANQNTVHLKTGFIWKFSREWLLWTGYASGGSLRKKPKSPTVKYWTKNIASLFKEFL